MMSSTASSSSSGGRIRLLPSGHYRRVPPEVLEPLSSLVERLCYDVFTCAMCSRKSELREASLSSTRTGSYQRTMSMVSDPSLDRRSVGSSVRKLREVSGEDRKVVITPQMVTFNPTLQTTTRREVLHQKQCLGGEADEDVSTVDSGTATTMTTTDDKTKAVSCGSASAKPLTDSEKNAARDNTWTVTPQDEDVLVQITTVGDCESGLGGFVYVPGSGRRKSRAVISVEKSLPPTKTADEKKGRTVRIERHGDAFSIELDAVSEVIDDPDRILQLVQTEGLAAAGQLTAGKEASCLLLRLHAKDGTLVLVELGTPKQKLELYREIQDAKQQATASSSSSTSPSSLSTVDQATELRAVVKQAQDQSEKPDMIEQLTQLLDLQQDDDEPHVNKTPRKYVHRWNDVCIRVVGQQETKKAMLILDRELRRLILERKNQYRALPLRLVWRVLSSAQDLLSSEPMSSGAALQHTTTDYKTKLRLQAQGFHIGFEIDFIGGEHVKQEFLEALTEIVEELDMRAGGLVERQRQIQQTQTENNAKRGSLAVTDTLRV